MKVSELVEKLQTLQSKVGNVEVIVETPDYTVIAGHVEDVFTKGAHTDFPQIVIQIES